MLTVAKRWISFFKQGAYACQYEWPDDASCQCASKNEYLEKSFFEAFPDGYWIRGDADTIELAEDKAWNIYSKYMLCKGHSYVRGERRDGGGYCSSCGYFKKDAFESLEHCLKCGIATYYRAEKDGTFLCKDCYVPVKKD
jgi:hypothetical protein